MHALIPAFFKGTFRKFSTKKRKREIITDFRLKKKKCKHLFLHFFKGIFRNFSTKKEKKEIITDFGLKKMHALIPAFF